MDPYWTDGQATFYLGDVLDTLREMPDESVHCVVTSQPYWCLRDYGCTGQLGLEATFAEYIERMTEVFREVRRVLRSDGVCWVNMGDSYAAGGMSNPSASSTLGGGKDRGAAEYSIERPRPPGTKPKDLLGQPWALAFALRDDGWWLRAEVIWAKSNPMPESVTDRPTKAHEQVFLLTKSARYWYDADAVREEAEWARWGAQTIGKDYRGINPVDMKTLDMKTLEERRDRGRNARSVWTIATEPYPEAHFATFPTELPRRCILAGCPADGVVLDPFLGSGTTAWVAKTLGRRAVGIELNEEYIALAVKRNEQMAMLA